MAACNKAVLLADAVTNQFSGAVPEVRDALMLQMLYDIRTAIVGNSPSKWTILMDAQANGFTGVEPRKRDALILQLLCDIS